MLVIQADLGLLVSFNHHSSNIATRNLNIADQKDACQYDPEGPRRSQVLYYAPLWKGKFVVSCER